MDLSYLNEILIMFTAAVVVVIIFLYLELPPILGYLAVGVLMGPYGFALISNTEHIRAFAEFGVVLLLFTIGLEFSLPLLIRMKVSVLGLGGLQVLLTVAVTVVAAMYLGMSLASSLILGGVVAMSSTAMVTSQLSAQHELHSRHGRNAIGILLFQDIMVIPFLILVANLSKPSGLTTIHVVVTTLAEGLLGLVAILTIGRWVLQPLFRLIARFKSTELFTLTALLVALTAAWLTHQVGLSLALGAFVAGMMLAETEFRHQLEAEIRPFRDILLGLFFITIGMLLNIRLLPQVWPWVILLLSALVLFKLALVTILCRMVGWDWAVSTRTGVVLAHGGEFGFAILALALRGNLLPPDYGQVVLASLLISMGFAPLFIRFNQRLVSLLLPVASSISETEIKNRITDTAHDLNNHVIICGYGRVGQNVASFLEGEGIEFIALDLDPVLVQNAIKAKKRVTYGNASNIELLNAAGLSRASALVFCLDNVTAVLKVLYNVRRINREIPVLVRTTDDSYLEQLQKAGATEVIPETMEASLMLSAHLLLMLGKPVSHVFYKIRQVRKDRYKLLRRLFPGEETITMAVSSGKEQLQAIELTGFIQPGQIRISDLGLEEQGLTVVAIQRQDNQITDPDSQTLLLAGDTLVLFGTPTALQQAKTIMSKKLIIDTDRYSRS
jgi:K+:H+ antiporter